jgi:hypothetical protein
LLSAPPRFSDCLPIVRAQPEKVKPYTDSSELIFGEKFGMRFVDAFFRGFKR